MTAPFLSTLPGRGATGAPKQLGHGVVNFYPRSPRGERPPDGRSGSAGNSDFYPRSPRGERPTIFCPYGDYDVISIHAPREGSDPPGQARGSTLKGISIHAPREGSDMFLALIVYIIPQFLSTLPARGATGNGPNWPPIKRISIHAPREGSDYELIRRGPGNKNFYPRSPRGERPFVGLVAVLLALISIHAPREGSDAVIRSESNPADYFYPRSPRGERHPHFGGQHPGNLISIHAPREGSDCPACGGQHVVDAISIHAPREGSDSKCAEK